jgi:hypothetical protein
MAIEINLSSPRLWFAGGFPVVSRTKTTSLHYLEAFRNIKTEECCKAFVKRTGASDWLGVT